MSGFASVQFPDGLLRDSQIRPKYHREGYLDALDRDTLWYDAFWRDRRLFLVAPPFANLWPVVKSGRFLLDGKPARLLRRRRYLRHEVLEIEARTPATEIALELAGQTVASPISPDESNRFAGHNVMFYINRNNDLGWLVDHARYHRALHGAEALIVLDNASSLYSVSDIETALAPVGLDLLVLPAPFKYGPRGLKPFGRREKFLQTALFNILRLRFLRKARAILSCDVDELILTQAGSVFDAARNDRLGFVQIAGAWHHPAPASHPPYTHADHAYHHAPPRRCPTKWCLRPDGPLGGWSWDIHGLEWLPLLHKRTHKAFRFAHCRNISTGWKSQKRLRVPTETRLDPLAKSCLVQSGLAKPSEIG